MTNKEMAHWWQGYVIIRVRGKHVERLINKLMKQRVQAWNMSRTSSEDVQLSITLRDFYSLRMLLKETGCRVRIVEKIGFPFQLKKVKRRLGLLIGVCLFAMLLYLFSMMIWTIEIEGISIPEEQQIIIAELNKLGVQRGKFKFQAADQVQIKQTMTALLPNVTWVGFEYQGTTAILRVVEKTIPEKRQIIPPRHLVAKKKAIIHDMFVEEGQPQVKPNQYVQPGQLLVLGMVDPENEHSMIGAKANILGEVWYESNLALPLTSKSNSLTGEVQDSYYLKLGSLPIKLWGYNQKKYTQTIEKKDDYTLGWKDWQLPITWSKVSLMEAEEIEKVYSEEEAVQLAIHLSRKKLLQNLPADVEIKEENVLRKRVENDKVYIKMHFTVIEDIASEQLIFQGD